MTDINELLGSEAKDLLEYRAKVPRDTLHVPGPDFIDRVFVYTDRSARVLQSIASIFNHGRLAGTGYLSMTRLK